MSSNQAIYSIQQLVLAALSPVFFATDIQSKAMCLLCALVILKHVYSKKGQCNYIVETYMQADLYGVPFPCFCSLSSTQSLSIMA